MEILETDVATPSKENSGKELAHGKPRSHKKNQQLKKPKSTRIAFGIVFAIFILYAAYILFFFLFAFLISVKENMVAYTQDQIAGRLFRWPEHFTLKHYIESFDEWKNIDGSTTYLDMTINSVWFATLFPLVSAFVTAQVTYILANYRSKFTRALYKVGLFVATLPVYGAGAAAYRLYSQMGILNSPAMIITNISLFSGPFFYYYAFWKSIPWEFAEAAEIDGCNHYDVFFRIMLPMLLPSAAALYVISFITHWNNYSYNLLYLKSYPSLAYGAYAYSEIAKYAGNTPAYFAGVLISLLPVLILFGAFQNTIMEKVFLGGLKG